jgi:hypothetical protein
LSCYFFDPFTLPFTLSFLLFTARHTLLIRFHFPFFLARAHPPHASNATCPTHSCRRLRSYLFHFIPLSSARNAASFFLFRVCTVVPYRFRVFIVDLCFSFSLVTSAIGTREQDPAASQSRYAHHFPLSAIRGAYCRLRDIGSLPGEVVRYYLAVRELSKPFLPLLPCWNMESTLWTGTAIKAPWYRWGVGSMPGLARF